MNSVPTASAVIDSSRLNVPWRLREISPRLREHYLAEGWWRDQTFGEFLQESFADLNDAEFMIHSDTQPYVGTIGDVADRVRRFAARLQVLGIRPGQVVAIQLPNWMEAATAFWAAAWAGAISVPIAHFYGRKELEFILRDSGARVLVTTTSFRHLDYLQALDAIWPELPDLETLVLVGERGPSEGLGDQRRVDGRRRQVLSFDEALQSAPLAEPVCVRPEEPTVIAYTSGTTSQPKGVIHAHYSLLAGIRMPLDSADGRKSLVGTPVGHVTGMTKALLLPLLKRRPIHMIDIWNPTIVISTLEKYDLALDGAPSYFIKSVIEDPSFDRKHLAHIKEIGLGGAKVLRTLVDELDGLGCDVKRVYGSSEALTTTATEWDDPKPKRMYTDGRPMHGTELRLIDTDGRNLENGAPGEILIRSPRLFLGYTDQELTGRAVDGEGWYHSGDIGVLDDDGYLIITDRVQDIIIRGGENISAAEVEELVARIPRVGDVAVVSGPDARFGERVCAFVVPSSDSPPSLAEIQRYLAESGLSRPKWPEELHIVSEMPRTPSGKVKKHELRTRLQERSAPAGAGQRERPVA